MWSVSTVCFMLKMTDVFCRVDYLGQNFSDWVLSEHVSMENSWIVNKNLGLWHQQCVKHVHNHKIYSPKNGIYFVTQNVMKLIRCKVKFTQTLSHTIWTSVCDCQIHSETQRSSLQTKNNINIKFSFEDIDKKNTSIL